MLSKKDLLVLRPVVFSIAKTVVTTLIMLLALVLVDHALGFSVAALAGLALVAAVLLKLTHELPPQDDRYYRR